jgi:RNA polymerase sigma-70 factor (ECF subfamily)
MRAFAADSPAAKAELASDLSLALLHVLERLSPEERAAFILHDAFDCEYAEIAAILNKTEPACRKLVSRARERVRTDRPRFAVSDEQHQALLARFGQAVAAQDAAQLADLFAPDAVFYSDGGGRVPAALLPVRGPDKMTRLILGLMKKYRQGTPGFAAITLNGGPGLLITDRGELHSAIGLETDGTHITAVYVMRNPEKLSRIAAAME